jgi:AbrB family looped-hinge helix DNA binding protein
MAYYLTEGTVNEVYHTTLGTGGRLVLPAELRQALGLRDGDHIVLQKNGNTVVLASQDSTLKEVQEFFRELVPEGVSLVDELLEERREEVRRKDKEGRG